MAVSFFFCISSCSNYSIIKIFSAELHRQKNMTCFSLGVANNYALCIMLPEHTGIVFPLILRKNHQMKDPHPIPANEYRNMIRYSYQVLLDWHYVVENILQKTQNRCVRPSSLSIWLHYRSKFCLYLFYSYFLRLIIFKNLFPTKFVSINRSTPFGGYG